MDQSSRELRWSAVFTDFRSSGLTQAQFCQLRDISLNSFRYWIYRLRPGLPPQQPRSTRRSQATSLLPTPIETPAFLPVHVRPRSLDPIVAHQVAQPQALLELVLSDRCHLRVPAGFDPATLHQVLDVLEERS
jgi:hypothetical protein